MNYKKSKLFLQSSFEKNSNENEMEDSCQSDLNYLIEVLDEDPNPQSVLDSIILIFEAEPTQEIDKNIIIDNNIGDLLLNLFSQEKIDYLSLGKVMMYLSALCPHEITLNNDELIPFVVEQLNPDSDTLILWLYTFQNLVFCNELQQSFRENFDFSCLEPIVLSSPDVEICKILLTLFAIKAEVPLENENLVEIILILLQNVISDQEKYEAFELAICLIYDLLKFTPEIRSYIMNEKYFNFFKSQIYSESICTQYNTLKIINILLSLEVSFMDILDNESDLKFLLGSISHQNQCIQAEALKIFISIIMNDPSNDDEISQTIAILKSIHFLSNLLSQVENISGNNNYYYIKLLYVYLSNSDNRDLRISLKNIKILSPLLVDNLESEETKQINGTLEIIIKLLNESINCDKLIEILETFEEFELKEKLNELAEEEEMADNANLIINSFYNECFY